MRLQSEFTVPAPVEEVWRVLLDLERAAACLPGAKPGSLKVKLGAVSTVYRGTVRVTDSDEQARTASIAAQAREAKGSGTAAAVVTARLAAEGGGTRVRVETDLELTGRQAQLGREVLEEAAEQTLAAFAAELAREVATPRSAATPSPAPAAASPAGDDEVLDLGNVLAGTPMARAGIAGAVVLALLALLGLRARSPRGLSFRVTLR